MAASSSTQLPGRLHISSTWWPARLHVAQLAYVVAQLTYQTKNTKTPRTKNGAMSTTPHPMRSPISCSVTRPAASCSANHRRLWGPKGVGMYMRGYPAMRIRGEKGGMYMPETQSQIAKPKGKDVHAASAGGSSSHIIFKRHFGSSSHVSI